MKEVKLQVYVEGFKTDREGNCKITFNCPPADQAKVSAVAMCVNTMLEMTVREAPVKKVGRKAGPDEVPEID